MSSSASRREQAAHDKALKRLNREIIALEFLFQPAELRYRGPLIETPLTITQAHHDALVAAGAPIPAPVMCRFLLDTGADGCVVKHEFATRAGLKLINANAPLHGVGVDTSGKAYMGRILFVVPSLVIPTIKHNVHIDTQVMSGDLKSDQIDGLIGRDVLQHFVMSYDGKTGLVTMRYHRNTGTIPQAIEGLRR